MSQGKELRERRLEPVVAISENRGSGGASPRLAMEPVRGHHSAALANAQNGYEYEAPPVAAAAEETRGMR